jgi:hypothetical protein
VGLFSCLHAGTGQVFVELQLAHHGAHKAQAADGLPGLLGPADQGSRPVLLASAVAQASCRNSVLHGCRAISKRACSEHGEEHRRSTSPLDGKPGRAPWSVILYMQACPFSGCISSAAELSAEVTRSPCKKKAHGCMSQDSDMQLHSPTQATPEQDLVQPGMRLVYSSECSNTDNISKARRAERTAEQKLGKGRLQH